MKLYFSNNQHVNTPGGTESIGDMETLESQGKPQGASGLVSGGRSPGLPSGLGPQTLLQAESGRNAYIGYNGNPIVHSVNRQNQ